MLKKIAGIYISFYYPLIKTLVKILSFILLVIVLVELFIVFADKSNMSGYSIYVIESNSMKPTLEKGDFIVAEKRENYKIGDIITFYPKDNYKKPYTHRIIEKNKQNNKIIYKTQGDNNDLPDNFEVKKELIEGTLYKHIPKLGEAVLFLRSVEGIILLIIIPSTILFTVNAYDLYQWINDFYQNNKIF